MKSAALKLVWSRAKPSETDLAMRGGPALEEGWERVGGTGRGWNEDVGDELLRGDWMAGMGVGRCGKGRGQYWRMDMVVCEVAGAGMREGGREMRRPKAASGPTHSQGGTDSRPLLSRFSRTLQYNHADSIIEDPFERTGSEGYKK
jgi:hypothetical protein